MCSTFISLPKSLLESLAGRHAPPPHLCISQAVEAAIPDDPHAPAGDIYAARAVAVYLLHRHAPPAFTEAATKLAKSLLRLRLPHTSTLTALLQAYPEVFELLGSEQGGRYVRLVSAPILKLAKAPSPAPLPAAAAGSAPALVVPSGALTTTTKAKAGSVAGTAAAAASAVGEDVDPDVLTASSFLAGGLWPCVPAPAPALGCLKGVCALLLRLALGRAVQRPAAHAPIISQ